MQSLQRPLLLPAWPSAMEFLPTFLALAGHSPCTPRSSSAPVAGSLHHRSLPLLLSWPLLSGAMSGVSFAAHSPSLQRCFYFPNKACLHQWLARPVLKQGSLLATRQSHESQYRRHRTQFIARTAHNQVATLPGLVCLGSLQPDFYHSWACHTVCSHVLPVQMGSQVETPC